MTYKNLILLFILIYAAKSLAQVADCQISTTDKILYLQKDSITPKQLVLESDCSNEVLAKFSNEILDVTGNISAHFLEEKIPGLKLTPQRIFISPVAAVMAQQLNLPSEVVIDQVRSAARNVFLLDNAEQLNFTTPNQLLGTATVAMEQVNPLTSGQQKFWLTVVFKAKVMALVANKMVDRSFGALRSEYFQKKEVVTEHPDRLFTQFDRVQHFSLNRSIPAGHVLQRSETIELPLVTYGVAATVILNNNGIQLNGSATPMRTANYGDFIQLKNTRSNKVITAKVVDFNKVLIQL